IAGVLGRIGFQQHAGRPPRFFLVEVGETHAAARTEGFRILENALDLGITADGEGIPFVEVRSEEHTSELQSRENIVCRLLLETSPRPPSSTLSPSTTLFRSRLRVCSGGSVSSSMLGGRHGFSLWKLVRPTPPLEQKVSGSSRMLLTSA